MLGAPGTGVYVGKHRSILGTEVLEDLTTVRSNFRVSGNLPSLPSSVLALRITRCLNLIASPHFRHHLLLFFNLLFFYLLELFLCCIFHSLYYVLMIGPVFV